MSKNKSYKPNQFLSKYIDRFYTFEKSAIIAFELPPILPGTGLELLFHTDIPLSIDNIKLNFAHIVCPRKLSNFEQTKKVSFLSVRFKSGAFRHFTNIPYSKLNNNYLSVENIWGVEGKQFLMDLNNINTPEDKIPLIEQFLTSTFEKYHLSENDYWDGIIDDLYYNFKENSIKELSKKSNLSLRQFERNFKNQFGITPKMFQKITRFQNTAKKILLSSTTDYLKIVLDNGYFDQSHFIKDFKLFTTKKPTTYFVEENFKENFYHIPLKQL